VHTPLRLRSPHDARKALQDGCPNAQSIGAHRLGANIEISSIVEKARELPSRWATDAAVCSKESTRNLCEIWVQPGAVGLPEILWTPTQVIGAVLFQSVTSETSAVTTTGSNRARHGQERDSRKSAGSVLRSRLVRSFVSDCEWITACRKPTQNRSRGSLAETGHLDFHSSR